MEIILNKTELSGAIRELALALSARLGADESLVIAGIQQGGAEIGERIMAELRGMHPGKEIRYGQLDVTFYRDDIRNNILAPDTMNMPFDIANRTVVLVDDVLFTGRTIKAALDTLLDLGRPAKVELFVLIDRKEHRQFPIQADFAARTVLTRKTDKVKLVNGEVVLIPGQP